MPRRNAQDRKSDLDGDGFLSALEIFQEAKRRVEEIYQRDNLIQKEQTMLDGDGDGRADDAPRRTATRWGPNAYAPI